MTAHTVHPAMRNPLADRVKTSDLLRALQPIAVTPFKPGTAMDVREHVPA